MSIQIYFKDINPPPTLPPHPPPPSLSKVWIRPCIVYDIRGW